LDELTERVIIQARRVLTAHGVLDGGTTFSVDPATLYADESVRALWSANPMQVDYHEKTLQIGVDYGDTPAVVPNSVKTMTVHLTNPHPIELHARCSLEVPQGWEHDSEPQAVTIPPQTTTTVKWEIPIPSPEALANSNTLRLLVEVPGRPALPAVPIVLIGARRFRYAGPFSGSGAADGDMLHHAFEPEQQGNTVRWNEGFALDNALPLGDVFTTAGALYVQTYLWSNDVHEAWIGAPANCPTKLWVNGTLAVENTSYRPVRPNYGGDGDSYAHVSLAQGWNELMIKFVRGADAAPFEAHLLASTPDRLHNGLEQLGWTRLPSDVLV
jgi:hypothetical protein